VAPPLSFEMTACALEPTDLRRVFGAYPTGVTAVAALIDGVPVGITANSFTSVSLDPPILSVSVAHTSTRQRNPPGTGSPPEAANPDQGTMITTAFRIAF
jgi:flavin reductase (DIM6/NTAB) family NADH-FMN oxidoreductase RutF